MGRNARLICCALRLLLDFKYFCAALEIESEEVLVQAKHAAEDAEERTRPSPEKFPTRCNDGLLPCRFLGLPSSSRMVFGRAGREGATVLLSFTVLLSSRYFFVPRCFRQLVHHSSPRFASVITFMQSRQRCATHDTGTILATYPLLQSLEEKRLQRRGCFHMRFPQPVLRCVGATL